MLDTGPTIGGDTVSHDHVVPVPAPLGLKASRELVEFALELAKSVDRKLTASLCANCLARAIDGSLAAVYLADAEGKLVLQGHAGELPEEWLEQPPSLAEGSFAQGSIEALSGRGAEEALPELGEAARVVAAPIASWEGRFGAAIVATSSRAHGATEMSRFLSAVADLAAASLANTQRLRDTSAEARRDPLTGLGNRRAFHEHLDYALELATRRVCELSLVLFDLDDFKQINDSEGHLVGDGVLRDLARVALGVLRTGEEAFRLGGDEFAIVVEGSQDVGSRVAERVRRALGRKSRGHGLPTISAGVAAYPLDADDREALIHKADLALYAAKERGKDRAVSYHGRLAAETHSVRADTNRRLEGEWWSKVLGSRSRGRLADEAGPGGRPQDVAQLAERVAARAGLPHHTQEAIGLAAYLTELGKLRIPEAIRRKRAPLTERDRATIREAAEVVASTLAPMGYLGEVLEIVQAAHERWDGTGYPNHLMGEEAPLGARVVAVCEAFCALTSGRTYRSARSRAGALLELKAHAGTHFDPACVEALAEVLDEGHTASDADGELEVSARRAVALGSEA